MGRLPIGFRIVAYGLKMQSRSLCTAGQGGVQTLPPTEVSVRPCQGLAYSAVAWPQARQRLQVASTYSRGQARNSNTTRVAQRSQGSCR